MRNCISATIFVVLFFFCIIPAAGSGELNQEGLDRLIKSKWNEMKAALAKQDVDTAVSYFVEEQREHYQRLFTTLYDNLPQMVEDMYEIELVEFEGRRADYRIRRDEISNGKTFSLFYEIIFLLDKDDIWRIYRY